jgi:SNF2 family DNA or RNA helicase
MRLHDYQRAARDFVLQRVASHNGAGLWLDPGLGKTAVTLHALELLRMLDGVKTTTVVAPARVIETAWPVEIKDWGLPFTWSWIKGDEAERQAALDAKPDIYFISCESLAKAVVDNSFFGDGFKVTTANGAFVLEIDGQKHNFDSTKKLVAAFPQCEEVLRKRFRLREQLPNWLDRMKFRTDVLVVDEITKFKNWTASRTKYLRKLVARIPRRITLTGTPVPNNLGEDLFPQQFVLDEGKTLGTAITKFRDQWMRPCGYEGREYEMVPGLQQDFVNLISPWYLRQDILDHLDMPALVKNEIKVKLPENARLIYKKIEREMYAQLAENELVAISGGGKYNLCRQIASGSAYDPDKKVVHIHTAKVESLADLFEELNGKPLLVAYCFEHELAALLKRWPNLVHLKNGQSLTEIIANWRSGKTKMLAAQCQALSHGVNGLQSGNDICWFSQTDQPDTRTQLEARIYRQGVRGPQVRIHYLIAEGTIEVKIKRTLDDKNATQKDVLDAIKCKTASN